MATKPTGSEGLIDATRALAARMGTERATPMSPAGFHHRQGVWTYEPPSVSSSPLYVAPEVATLDAPPSADTERYEAAMCLRSLIEGEALIERRFLKASGARTLDDAFTRLLNDSDLTVPAPTPKAYRGLGRAGELLGAMTRRDPAQRPAPSVPLLDVAAAVDVDGSSNGSPGAASGGLFGALGGLLKTRAGNGDPLAAQPGSVIRLRVVAGLASFVLLPNVPGAVAAIELDIEGVTTTDVGLWTWAQLLESDAPASSEQPPSQGTIGHSGVASEVLSVPIALPPGAAFENQYQGAAGRDDPRRVEVTPSGATRSYTLVARLDLGPGASLDVLA